MTLCYGDQFVDHISDNCIAIERYNDKEVEGYFYDIDLNKFYKRCDDKFRVLRIWTTDHGEGYVNMIDKNKSKFHLNVKKFKIMNEIEDNNDDAQYVKDISDDCYVIDFYGKRLLEGYFYDATLDKFYRQCGERFKVLHVCESHGEGHVNMCDKNNTWFKFAVKKFKRIIKKQEEEDAMKNQSV